MPSAAIRPYRPADAPALLALCRESIRRVASRDYNAEQITAWASDEIDPAAWAARFDGRYAIVAEADGQIAGFTELEPDGHIDRFYVSADHQRQGVGRALMENLRAEASRRQLPVIFLEGSVTAKPFFELQGFRTIASQRVVVRGVEFVNHRMERQLR